jgi:hypothetical protein
MRRRRVYSVDVDVFGGRCLMSTINESGLAVQGLVEGIGQGDAPARAIHPGLQRRSLEFIRFNKGKVRQAGNVQQASLSLKLINDGRHADMAVTLAGEAEVDNQRLAEAPAATARHLAACCPKTRTCCSITGLAKPAASRPSRCRTLASSPGAKSAVRPRFRPGRVLCQRADQLRLRQLRRRFWLASGQ